MASTVPPEWISVLRQCTYFVGLDDHELMLIGQLCSEVEFAPGETVQYAGTPTANAHVIVHGHAAMFFRGQGERVPVGTRGRGELLGPLALVSTQPVSYHTATCLSPVRALRIPGQEFRALADYHPEIEIAVLTAAVCRLNQRVYELYDVMSPASPSEPPGANPGWRPIPGPADEARGANGAARPGDGRTALFGGAPTR